MPVLSASHVNTKTRGSSNGQLMLVMVSSVASDIFEWNNNHAQFFHSRIKVDTCASFFFPLSVQTAFVHFPKEQAERALSQGMCLQVAH